MFDGHRRWTLLAVLAAGNLVLWMSVACLVGLCAGDDVDLGVETLVRHAQATAVTSWEEARTGGPPRLAGEGSPSGRARSQEGGASVAPALAAADVDLEENPIPTVPPAATYSTSNSASSNAGIATTPTLLPPATGSLQGSPEPGAEPLEITSAADASPSVAAGPASATPGSVARAAVSSPLLLVDPEFHDLAALNSEMERSAPERAVQIRYQEEALNRELAAIWHNNPALPYRDVQVNLQHNGVAISGRVTVLGFEVDALLEGTVVAQDCLPRLEIDSVSLAGVTTPRFVRTRVAAMAQEAMAWYPADYPLCLEQIVLEETRATFYGYRR